MTRREPTTINSYTCRAISLALLSSAFGCGDASDASDTNGDGDGDGTLQAGVGGTPVPMGAGGLPGTGGAPSSGGSPSAGGAPLGSGGQASGGTGSGGEQAVDPLTFAEGLDELFIDRPCVDGTSLPLANGAVCDHANPLYVEETLIFGGDAGTTYDVTLRVRGIWEPTNIDGGELPYLDVPFNVGGDVAAGTGSDSDAINYQQFYIVVDSPAQTYWLNNHDYVAHDIHKEDYEATIQIAGGSTVTVVANDGNEREIANYPQDFFADLPPYDQTPTLGQFLHLEVVSVVEVPAP